MGKRSKKGQVWDTLIPWIIAIVVLVFMLIFYFVLKDKGTGALEFFRDLWRFR